MDALIVIEGWISTIPGADYGEGLVALRLFRLLRVFRAARSAPQLQSIGTTVDESIPRVQTLSTKLVRWNTQS